MKRFEFPELNIEMFISEDVITTSGAAAPATNIDSVQQQMYAMNNDINNKRFVEVMLMN